MVIISVPPPGAAWRSQGCCRSGPRSVPASNGRAGCCQAHAAMLGGPASLGGKSLELRSNCLWESRAAEQDQGEAEISPNPELAGLNSSFSSKLWDWGHEGSRHAVWWHGVEVGTEVAQSTARNHDPATVITDRKGGSRRSQAASAPCSKPGW